jgi:hypothetical protein
LYGFEANLERVRGKPASEMHLEKLTTRTSCAPRLAVGPGL